MRKLIIFLQNHLRKYFVSGQFNKENDTLSESNAEDESLAKIKLKIKNMWMVICNYLKNFDGQDLANLITFFTFIWTVGKDFLLWVISLFNPYKSNAMIRFSDNNTKMFFSLNIQNKKENFIITEIPDIEFISGIRLFNHIFNESKLSNKEYDKNNNKNTLNENTSNHMFQYDLSFLDYLNFNLNNKIYVRITTTIDSNPRPKIFIHSLSRMFKHKINRTNYEEFTKKTLDKFSHLLNYKK